MKTDSQRQQEVPRCALQIRCYLRDVARLLNPEGEVVILAHGEGSQGFPSTAINGRHQEACPQEFSTRGSQEGGR